MKTPAPVLPEVAARPGKTTPVLTESGACTIQEAAEFFDIAPRKLAGLMQRNRVALGDPIGNVFENWVYLASVQRYLERVNAGK